MNKNGYHKAVKELNIKMPAWHSEYERLYSGAEECLKVLSEKYKIGIIANQPEGTKARLEKFGILKYIDVVASFFEEGTAKPELKLFEIAMKKAENRQILRQLPAFSWNFLFFLRLNQY